MSATWKWGLSSWAKAWSQCSWHTYIHTHIRITGRNLTTGKALSQNRQENSGKPGYNLALMEPKRFPPGRWALSYWEKPKDRQRKLHPGKCLCSTLSSLAFYSQMSDYSSTLNLWERGGGDVEREILSIINFGSGGRWHSLHSLSQCELPIWQYSPQNIVPALLNSTGYRGEGGYLGKVSTFSPLMFNPSALPSGPVTHNYNWWTSYIWWFKIGELADWLGEALTNQRPSWSTLRSASEWCNVLCKFNCSPNELWIHAQLI